MDADRLCKAVGKDCFPFVVEVRSAKRRLFAYVAAPSRAVRGVDDVDEVAVNLVKSLTTTVQRETARAILRRLAPTSAPRPSACPEAWAERGPDDPGGIGDSMVAAARWQ